MREHDTYAGLINGAKNAGYSLYRIEDGSFGKKPFDIGGIGPNGEAMAVEVKIVAKPLDLEWKLPYRLLEPHQMNWLNECVEKGGLAWFVLAHDQGADVFELKENWMNKPSRESFKVRVVWTHEGKNSKGWSALRLQSHP